MAIVINPAHPVPNSKFLDHHGDVLYSFSLIMKKDLHHKDYRPVVFQDLNNSQTYLTRSTVATEDKITLDGVEYPLVKIHISSSSHPFFTGEERIVDIEGRVDKFKARAAAGEANREKRAAAAQKLAKRAAAKAEKSSDQTAKTGTSGKKAPDAK
jgi:large subunit ribosomal protein L31